MSNTQVPGPTHFQTVPPMGQRTPLGGGPSMPLATTAAPAPLGGAPVPPMQPSWATGGAQAPAAQPPPVAIINQAGVNVTEEIVQGLVHGAPVVEFQRYYPFVTVEQLRLLASQRGYTLNETQPQPAGAPAPAPVATAPQGAPIAAEKRKRLNKKDDVPRIEQLRKEGANAQQISDAIGLQLASVEKVLAGLEPAHAPAPDAYLEGIANRTHADRAEDFSPAPRPYAAPAVEESATLAGAVERALFVAHEVFTFARDRGISLAEIQAAANLLDVVQPVG